MISGTSRLDAGDENTPSAVVYSDGEGDSDLSDIDEAVMASESGLKPIRSSSFGGRPRMRNALSHHRSSVPHRVSPQVVLFAKELIRC